MSEHQSVARWPFRMEQNRRLDWPELPSIGELFGMAGNTIRLEESVTDDAYTLRAELPGVDVDKDVDITVSDGVLTIRAERRESKSSDAHAGRYAEFRYGEFARSVALPAGASEHDVKATYTNGVLQVTVPIKESAPAQRIPVQRA